MIINELVCDSTCGSCCRVEHHYTLVDNRLRSALPMDKPVHTNTSLSLQLCSEIEAVESDISILTRVTTPYLSSSFLQHCPEPGVSEPSLHEAGSDRLSPQAARGEHV